MKQDLPEKFILGYKRGQCLVCLEDSGSRLFCQKHLDEMAPKVEPETGNNLPERLSEIMGNLHDYLKVLRIQDLGINEEGYIDVTAIFEVDEQLYVIDTAPFSRAPEGYRSVLVRKYRGTFEINSATLDRDDIYFGWPAPKEELSYRPAKII